MPIPCTMLKVALEAKKTKYNCIIAAVSKIVSEKLEGMGVTSVQTSHGTLFIEDAPVVSFPDKQAFNEWIRKTGQEDLFSVNPDSSRTRKAKETA